jgi:hypothetical protein
MIFQQRSCAASWPPEGDFNESALFYLATEKGCPSFQSSCLGTHVGTKFRFARRGCLRAGLAGSRLARGAARTKLSFADQRVTKPELRHEGKKISLRQQRTLDIPVPARYTTCHGRDPLRPPLPHRSHPRFSPRSIIPLAQLPQSENKKLGVATRSL